MKVLFILNDPPYGTERSFNGLRLAKALQGKGMAVTVFLMADAVACAKAGQKVPQGYYLQDVVARAARETADAQQVLTQILATRPESAAPRIGSER